jgi:hypothetical protein
LGVWHPFGAVGRVPPSLPFAPRQGLFVYVLSQELKATMKPRAAGAEDSEIRLGANVPPIVAFRSATGAFPGRPLAGAKGDNPPTSFRRSETHSLLPLSGWGYDATSPVTFPAAVVPPMACLGKFVPLVSLVPTPRVRDKRYKRYKGRVQQSSAMATGGSPIEISGNPAARSAASRVSPRSYAIRTKPCFRALPASGPLRETHRS